MRKRKRETYIHTDRRLKSLSTFKQGSLPPKFKLLLVAVDVAHYHTAKPKKTTLTYDHISHLLLKFSHFLCCQSRIRALGSVFQES